MIKKARKHSLLSACKHGLSYFWENVTGAYAFKNVLPAVTVFGSARTKTDTPIYEQGVALGHLLAEAGLTVITGGGPGMMSAVHEGAHAAGGYCAGATIALDAIEPPNNYMHAMKKFSHFSARKRMLMQYSSAFIVFPGGLGTLDELFEVIVLMQTKFMTTVPVILIGSEFWNSFWHAMQASLQEHEMIGPNDLDDITITDNLEDVIRMVKPLNLK